MSTATTDFPQCIDDWLSETGPAAIVLREHLVPVGGKDTPVFPPTFAASEREDEDEDTTGAYNIDHLTPDGSRSVCLIDSVGSQANRLEPLFKTSRYAGLVPQVTIAVREGRAPVNLLDAGHRAADAIARFSTLQPRLAEAFRAIMEAGNAEPLAKISPTSVLFGVWDSRATQAKLPRLVSSVIRAYDVDVLTRSATYRSAIDYTAEGVVAEELDTGRGKRNPLSRDGMKYALATKTPGGVMVRTCIRRDATLSLTGVRALNAVNPERTRVLQRYILGLGLCALTAPQHHELRQGCHLVSDDSVKPNPQADVVSHSGQRDRIALDHNAALAYAETAATNFGVDIVEPASFDPEHADLWLRLPKDEQKKLTRSGRVSKEAIKQYLAEKNREARRGKQA